MMVRRDETSLDFIAIVKYPQVFKIQAWRYNSRRIRFLIHLSGYERGDRMITYLPTFSHLLSLNVISLM